MNISDQVRMLERRVAELLKLILNLRAAGVGETNTASNIGAGGVGVYNGKVGVDLQFRNINAASARVTVALDNPNHEVDIDVVQAQIDHGSIGGLADDDHTRYLDKDGSRALTGNWDAGLATGREVKVGKLISGGNVVAGGNVSGEESLHSEGRLCLKETTDPTSDAGYGKLWVSSADSILYFMDDAGAKYDLLAGGGGGAPDDAEYIVGNSNAVLSAERVKGALYDNYDLDDYPAVPDAMDDEFEDGAINVKWTLVNDPGGGDSPSESVYAGFLWCGLPEGGDTTMAFTTFIRLYQAPPGTMAQTYIAKVANGVTGLASSTDEGEFTETGIYIGDPTGKDAVVVAFHNNDAVQPYLTGRVQMTTWDNDVGGAPTYNNYQMLPTTSWLYIKLERSTANAWTSANTYNAYMSKNGMVWYQIGSHSFTFSNVPTEVGVYFRCPKLQGGTPHGEGIVDFFRRIV